MTLPTAYIVFPERKASLAREVQSVAVVENNVLNTAGYWLASGRYDPVILKWVKES